MEGFGIISTTGGVSEVNQVIGTNSTGGVTGSQLKLEDRWVSKEFDHHKGTCYVLAIDTSLEQPTYKRCKTMKELHKWLNFVPRVFNIFKHFCLNILKQFQSYACFLVVINRTLTAENAP